SRAALNSATPATAVARSTKPAPFKPLNHDKHPDFVPTPPANQALPRQEPGLRRARALPYELDAKGTLDVARHELDVTFLNTGAAGACFQVRSGNSSFGPWSYTVEAGKSLSDAWGASRTNGGRHDPSVFGPDCFLPGLRGGR